MKNKGKWKRVEMGWGMDGATTSGLSVFPLQRPINFWTQTWNKSAEACPYYSLRPGQVDLHVIIWSKIY